ncbi:metallopeptidase [Candidatus Pacearchaeota archaeon]|nr:metallopeptidase [Candidatus Pacearchaeota archaeon]
MGIKYELAEDLQEQVNDIAKLLFPHVKLDSVVCLRSYGSSSRGTIARCHALGKAMQLALGRKGFYAIEVISRRFDKMSEVDKVKTLIHELMHIPKTFGGGFIHHDVVHERNVEMMFQRYINLRKKERFVNSIIKGEGAEKAREESKRIEIDTLKKKWWF